MKNVHLPHFEDLVFMNQTDKLCLLTRRLIQNDSCLHLSKKIDGSPSVVIGTDPLSKQFFVGLKGALNVKPKVFYSESEIENYPSYNDNVKKILKSMLKHFKTTPPDGIVQGDFLFLKDDLRERYVDGMNMLTFKPNTLTYAVPKNIAKKKMGIVFHTAYDGPSLEKLNVVPREIKIDSSDCWIIDPTIKELKLDVVNILWVMDSIASFHMRKLNKNFMSKINPEDFIQFYNSMIRTGIPDDVHDIDLVFLDFVEYKYNKKPKNAILEFYQSSRYDIQNLFCLHGSFGWIKELILSGINRDEMIPMMEDGDKLVPTEHEGIVISDRSLNDMVKLVNRRVFSRANFNRDRV